MQLIFKLKGPIGWSKELKTLNCFKFIYMQRRNFLGITSILGTMGLVKSNPVLATNSTLQSIVSKGADDRAYWIQLMLKISNPILENMSQGKFRQNVPLEYSPTWDNRNKQVAYMEAFGRLIAGLAPFVALPDDNTSESKIREKMRLQIQQSLVHAVNPKSPDYLYWGATNSQQPLVDAAYIAQALLAAPKVLWEPLDNETKQTLEVSR